jgi:hypothetical protein
MNDQNQNSTHRVDFETYTISNGEYELTFSGVVLAYATGQRNSHINHLPLRWAAPRQRCSACRWTEVTIYKRMPPNSDNENDNPLHPSSHPNPVTDPPKPPHPTPTRVTTNPFLPSPSPAPSSSPPQPSDDTTLTIPTFQTYVVYTVGRSRVPGEVDLPKLVETASAYEVVEALTVRRTGGGGGEVFIPPQHLRALAAASQWDRDLRDAYINRAIV